MKTLAERLEVLFREKPDAKPADLARACRIKPPSVSGWMSGKTKQLEATNAIRAAAFFGVHTWWLATGEGPMWVKEGQRDPQQPDVVANPAWPFTASFPEYSQLSAGDKRALDRVVSGFIQGASERGTA